jgi:hypothetical protein
MKKLMTCLLALTFLSAANVFAEGEKVITLKDGTRVNGRIVALDHGQYVIESGALGQLKVNEDNIVSIANPNIPAMANTQTGQSQPENQLPPEQLKKEMGQMQAQIMANPDIMKEIEALAQDPQILYLLNDPALLQAAQNKDPQAMQANPRVYELMNTPKMQELIRKIQGSQTGQK